MEEGNDLKWYDDLGVKGIRFGTFIVLCAFFIIYMTASHIVEGGVAWYVLWSFIGAMGASIIYFGRVIRRKYRLTMGLD